MLVFGHEMDMEFAAEMQIAAGRQIGTAGQTWL
jgi:hypothetical protein